MGCGQSSKASQGAQEQQQPKLPATGTDSTPGGSSSSSAPATGRASASAAAEQQPKGSATGSERLVVNAAATLLAAQAAGLALTAAEALPFAGPLIRSMQRVHTVFEIHEDIQQEQQLRPHSSGGGSAPQQPPGPVSARGSIAAAATPSALLAAGFDFSLLLLQKGKELISFGQNYDGRRDLPKELWAAGWTRGASRQRLRPSVEVLQVAACNRHTLYLVQEEKGEGRTAVHAEGNNLYKQCEVPQALGRGPKVKAVAAGEFHSLALTVAGKVLGWGWNDRGQTDVQAFEKVQLVAAGDDFSAVVTEDRKLHVVGDCDNKELKRGVQLSGTPIAMAAGYFHIVVLSSNGKAQGFRTSTKYDNYGQEIVPSSSIGERRIEAIACGGYHTVYLLEGGGVVAEGDNRHQQCDCRLQSSAIAVAAGVFHTLVLLKDGTLQTFGPNDHGECAVPEF